MLNEREQKIAGWAFTYAIERVVNTWASVPGRWEISPADVQRAIFSDPTWKEKLVQAAREAGL